MASIMTKRGSQDNVVTYEHICDTRADMASIDDRYVTLGSTCIILKGTSGGMEVYIADSNHQWQSLAIAGASGGSGGTVIVNSSPLFHVCTSSEVRANGTPKITSPEENTIYLVPINGKANNLFNEYLYVNSKWEMIGNAGTDVDLSEYVTQQDLAHANFATHNDLNNYATHDDLNDYASLDYNGKVSTEQLPFPAISSDDNDKILKVKNGNWSVENEVDISGKVDKAYEITFEPKTWNGLTSFSGDDIWTNGKNIYYSNNTEQYVLDKATSTWITKTWNGLTSFSGDDIWTDGENIYCSSLRQQYILDSSTSTWNTKTWERLTNFNGIDVWTDGENIYYSYQFEQYVLDKATSTWNTKTWNGLTRFTGRYIWTDGEHIYYSNNTEQYVLDKATFTWNAKTWNGLARFDGDSIWTDGDKIYCYEAYSDHQGVLDESTSTWNNKIWNGMPRFSGRSIWTDGESIYYSNNSSQYILGKNKILLGNNGTFSPVTLEEFTGTLMQKFPRIPEAPSTDEGHVYDFRLPKYASQQSYSEYHSESNPEGGSNYYPCIYTITTEDKQFVDGDRIIIPCIAKPNNSHIALQFGSQYYYIAVSKIPEKDYPETRNLVDIFLPDTYLELVYNANMNLSTYETTGHWSKNSAYIATGIFMLSYSGINMPHVHRINGWNGTRRLTYVEPYDTASVIPSVSFSQYFISDKKLIEFEQIDMMSSPIPGISSQITDGYWPLMGYFFTTNDNDYYPVIIDESKYPNDILEFAKNCVDYGHVTYIYNTSVQIDRPFYNLIWNKDTSTLSYEILDHYEGPAWRLTQVSPNCLGYFSAKRENTILGHHNQAITRYSDWNKNTSYNIGDCVYNSDEDKSYECIEANSDSTFTKEHWKELPTNYDRLLTIGNGKSSSELSNALTMDSKGNTIISGNFTASGGSLTIGNTTITEAQLISLLNSITG